MKKDKYFVKKIHNKSFIDLYKEKFKEQDEYLQCVQQEIINKILKRQDEFIEFILRNHVKPPIKGDITRGKITWRGLEIKNDIAYSKLWIKQRGVDIPIYFDYSINKLF